MPETLILSRSDVASLVTMAEVVAAVEAAFVAHGRGQVQMPPKVYLSLPEHGGDFRAMPAYMPASRDQPARAGVKWVNSHPGNPARHGLPAVMGTYVLSDPATAAPLAVMDATWLTAVRTGAAGAVASKFLAVGTPRSIGFVGCGVQAQVLLDAHRVLFAPRELRCADVRPDAAAAFAAANGGRVTSTEEACACDIVCTSTPGVAPVVRRAWLRRGTHVNAMGADAPGKQELDVDVLDGAKLVIDDHEQATHSGELNVAWSQGRLGDAQLYGTLGEIAAGFKDGRELDELTIFDSTGLAIQDLAVARLIHAAALRRDAGTRVDLQA
ncbi:MAG: ornithine cyclodeaminase family protein [Kofleriaceae bacterium]|nr:ornithine cyclodeaminase family protein [Kofleriaceae bacterium]MCB9575064.1 ornithine cyclodeaminase family protein [Kofleriaceae bacterium]